MTEPSRLPAIVTGPGRVRVIAERQEYACPDAESLPAGTRVFVTLESHSDGEIAVLAGNGTGSYNNSSLAGYRAYWGI
jgi:hypothetical protein